MITPDELDWTDPALVRRCESLLAQGRSSTEMARLLSAENGVEPALTKDTVQKRVQGLRRPSRFAAMPAASPTPVLDSILDRRAVRKPSLSGLVRRIERLDEATITIIADTHGRLVDEDALDWALSVAADSDLIVHGGDLFDFANQSLRHARLGHISFESELEGGARIVRAIEATGIDTIAIQGNHDTRPAKIFRQNLPSELLEFCEDNPLARLADRTSNVWTTDDFNEGWLVQVGDIVVSHAEVPNWSQSGARYLLDVLRNRGEEWGINGVVRGVFQAHHHQGRIEYVGRTVCALVPCLAQAAPYAKGPGGARYKSGQTLGAITLRMARGRLVSESVQLHVYPGAHAAKKAA